MNTKDIFELNRLRCDLAMAAALSSWQTPVSCDRLACPRCGSQELGKKGVSELGKRRYACKGCGRAFTEQPKFECTCQIPGRLPKCQDCKHFKQFLAEVKQKAKELRGLSRQELERLQG